MSATLSPSFARLIVPRGALVSCTPAYLVRSTLGSGASGFNHYPATPFCAVCWLLHGPTAVVENGVVSRELVADTGDAIFSGPQPQPWTTWNAAPTHFFVALFYPDALHALSGVDMADFVGKFLPAEQLLGMPWQDLAHTLIAAPDDDARAALVDDFLEARWLAARDGAGGGRTQVGDWARRLALQAAASGIGRSVRVAERRIKTMAGLPMRTLRRMGRGERVLLAARTEQREGKISWTGVAADAGFADQAHLTRETRAITGLSPTELARAIEHDDSYWMYRIWS
jgi:AraC-like DNA-binding protein